MPWTSPNNNDPWHKTAVSQITQPSVLVSSAGLTLASLGAIRVYKRHFRRITSIGHIKPDEFRKRSIFGRVTSVGDGDNFRLYHTPGGRWAGWGWGRRVPGKREELKDQTIHIRIAGVDAPELAHFGRPAQPYGQEALEFLTGYILHKRVRAYIWRRDQYDRAVATVFIRKRFGLFRKDVGLEMLKAGLATVYEARTGSEFGNREDMYKTAEEKAKAGKVGMWKERSVWDRLVGSGKLESPREYKSRMLKEEKGTG